MTPEGAVLKSIMDYLQIRRVLAFRCNTGAVKVEGRFIQFGSPGFADIIATPTVSGLLHGLPCSWTVPLFIECKSEKGRQSFEQKVFERTVKDAGCEYLLARSVDDVEQWLRKHGVK